MGEAIGQVLLFAIGVAISPIPIIAVVLMLATPRGHVNGPAFLVGWVAGLSVAGTVILVVSSGAGASDDGGPATWVSLLKLVLGLLLVALAVKQWRGRPTEGEEAALPAWMATVDNFAPPTATGAGVLLAVNPKNLILTAGAAAAIAQTGITTGEQAIALAVFVAVGTLGAGIPVVISFAADRAQEILTGVKEWMARQNAVIMAVLCLVIGVKLIGDAISGLAA